MKKITKKTKLSELVKENPKTEELLFKKGLSCIGCPMAMEETLEQGCKAHGIAEKDIDKMIEELNRKK